VMLTSSGPDSFFYRQTRTRPVLSGDHAKWRGEVGGGIGKMRTCEIAGRQQVKCGSQSADQFCILSFWSAEMEFQRKEEIKMFARWELV